MDKKKFMELLKALAEADGVEIIDGEIPDLDTNTVYAHYGVSRKDHNQTIKDIVADLIRHDRKSDTIDIHFKDMDEKQRAKVYAFHEAMSQWKRLRI